MPPTHPAKECPLQDAEGKMIKNIFLKDSLKRAEIKLSDAYVRCPTDIESIHKRYFIVDAGDEETVKFFGPLAVKVRQVSPFSQVAGKLWECFSDSAQASRRSLIFSVTVEQLIRPLTPTFSIEPGIYCEARIGQTARSKLQALRHDRLVFN